LHNYADIHAYKPAAGQSSPRLPAGTIPNAKLTPDQRLSWLVEILPFIEEDHLYRHLDLDAGWESPVNLLLSQTRIRLLDCGDWRREFSSAQPWETPYVGIAGLGLDAAALPLGAPNIGVFGYDRQVAFADAKDGTSNTLMVLESARDTGLWSQGGFTTVRELDPQDKPYLGVGRPFGGTHFSENHVVQRGHSIGCNALMMDGSVRFLSDSTSPEVLEALVTIGGGEKVPLNY